MDQIVFVRALLTFALCLLFFSPFFSGGEAVGTLAMPWELYGEFNKCTASFCAYLRNRERICVLFSLSSSFRLSVKVHACLCSLFFAPVNVFLGLCLAPLSLSIVSILLIFLTTYPSKHYVNLPSFSHLYCPPNIFRPLYLTLPSFPLLSLISWSQRPLFLYLSSYYVSLPSLCTLGSLALSGYSFPLLSLSYLLCTPLPCTLILAGLSGFSLSPSLHALYLSIYPMSP